MNLIPLTELYNERRYYREFHHKLFTLFMTVYLSAIVGQTIATTQLSAAPCWVIWSLFIVLAIVLPIYNTYIFLRYHLVIYGLNAVINSTLNKVKKSKIDDASKLAVEWHLGQAQKPSWKAVFEGQGHWYFISTMWLLVIINGSLLSRHL